MDRTIVFSSLVVLLALLFPARALSQRTNGSSGDTTGAQTLSGTVFTEQGDRPVMHARVRLCDGGGNMLTDQMTQDDGIFAFRGLQRGSYILEISANGFASTTVNIDLSFSSDRGVTISLKRSSTDSNEQEPPPATISAHEMSMPKVARQALASGMKKMNVNRDPKSALADFQSAVAAAPGYYEAYYLCAVAYTRLGNSAEAETNLRKAIEVSGDKFGEADVSLGTILLDRGQSAEGEKTLRRGIELSPDFWLGHYELGRALLRQEKVSEALKSAEQARSLSPGTAIIYRLLSNIHLREKDYAALLDDIDAYIKLDPDSPAGIRAKALREQVAQKVAATTPAKP